MERDDFSSNHHPALTYSWSMIFSESRYTLFGIMQVQYHDLTDAANLDTWRGMSYQTVLTPADEKTGNVICPYEKAQK